MPVLCVGLSHQTAPVAVRERLAFGADELRTAFQAVDLRAAAEACGVGELAVLSTCNRTELYAAGVAPSGPPPDAGPIASLLARARGVPPGFLEGHLYEHAGTPAVRHLCRVAAGLESMILGETEVLGQVGEADQAAAQAGTTGPILRSAFRSAVRAGRRARSETGISRKSASLAAEAARAALAAAGPPEEATILVIGTGRMGRLAAEVVRAHGVRSLRVVSRTAAHAALVADFLNAIALPWHALVGAIREADAVIACTSAPHPVVTRELVVAALEGRRPGRRLSFVDIALPRDVETAVRTLPGVTVCDLDALYARVHDNLEARGTEVPRVEAIIEEEVLAFEFWRRGAALRPVLAGLHHRGEEIRRRELESLLRQFGDDPEVRKRLDAFSRALVAKVLHEPLRRLRQEADPERSHTYAEAVRELFALVPEHHSVNCEQ